MHKTLFSLLLLVGTLLILSGCTQPNTVNTNSLPVISNQNTSSNTNQQVVNQNSNINQPVVNQPSNTNITTSEFISPLDRPSERLTKKLFGIYITPKTSPVQPERFSGYHTGVDFEILPGEENSAVIVKAFCPGKVVYKQLVSGYGGVFIQVCTVDNQTVTVLYGHLKMSSITAKVGDNLKVGDVIGELGQADSHDTDGERKHLHFGIRKGSTINVKGYVSNKNDLLNWLDPKKFL